jgi:hypothetical protein
MADLATAREVQALTIDQMSATLDQIDLTRAAILLRGPDEPVKVAFAALGRTPTVLQFDRAAADSIEDAPQATRPQRSRKEDIVRYSDLESSLTEQGPASPVGLTISAGYISASLVNLSKPLYGVPELQDATGLLVTGDLSLKVTSRYSAGLHLAIGNTTGTYVRYFDDRPSYGLIPIDVAASIQAHAASRFWGGPFIGLHLDGTRMEGELSWSSGLAIGVQGGVDALMFGPHRIGVMVRFGGSLGSSTGYGAMSASVTYRY